MPAIVTFHMAKGAGITEVAAVLKVSRETVYRWIDDKDKQYHRPFAEAIALGREASEAWWMRFGRLAMMQAVPAAPPSWWIFNMKNRHNWRDKTELSGNVDAPQQVTLKVYHFEGDKAVPGEPPEAEPGD